ncbi:MAG TPA: hypothetical protein VIL86_03175 [Tepidisphaeraceae bacterium]|jgi:hypothetical protein
MSDGRLFAQQVEAFNRDGFLFVNDLLNHEEVELLLRTAKADQLMQQKAMQMKDAAGKMSKLSLWNHPGDDIYGMIGRSHKVVDKMEQLLGGEVYHYHSKS